MSTLVTRSGKGSPLTHNEVDTNFTNLNTDKVEKTAADITGGTINNTTVGATTPSTGVFTTLTATGQTSLGGVAGAESLIVNAIAGSTRWIEIAGSVSGNTSIRTRGAGNPSFQFVNRGTGPITFSTADSLSNEQLRVSNTASAVNYVQVTGGATTKGVIQSAQGSDSNISYVTQSKGTGAIDLAAGSSGVNISNGGTVTAITRTATGGSYTSIPSVALTAPTTAGGVQATVSVGSMVNVAGTVASGGTGYTVGDTLSIVGGTHTGIVGTLTVTGVSGGVVTTVSAANFGQYAVLPTNPVSVTGGTGSGATLNLTWGIGSNPSFTITNAGSGYVEQPTVTFSGGGGSGASAYASVGGVAELKFIGTGTDSVTNQAAKITTSAGTAMTFRQIGGSDTFWQVGAASSTVGLIAKGNVNGNALVGANGTGSVRFTTNGDSINEQMRVANTASAVNYVQVTGAATGTRVTLSAQGSDATVGMTYSVKGSNLHAFTNSEGTQFAITATGATIANRLNVAGAATGQSPALTVSGTDANSDLRLVPLGTGRVQFGTYTASVLTPTGYIEIKDSGGTTRRLLVG